MTRLLFDHGRPPVCGGESAASADDVAFHGRSRASIDDDTRGARLGRQRDDPSGRRSLTGLEFRRQRSI